MNNKCKYISLVLLSVFCEQDLSAQLLNEFVSITMRDHVYWNPAAIAIDGRPSTGIIYKDVHMGLDQSPLHYSANYQHPVRFQNSAFSAILRKDYLGDLRQTQLSFGYRYTLFNHRLDDQRLFLGLSTDFMQDRLLAENHFAKDVDDPLILLENENAYKFDLNAGVFYQIDFPSEDIHGSSTITAGWSLNNLRGGQNVFLDTMDIVRTDRLRHSFSTVGWLKDFSLFDLDVRYFNSWALGKDMNHTMLLSLKDVYYQSFTIGYSTSNDLILGWGFDMTDYDDAKIEADISLFYGLDQVLETNRNGLQVSIKYLFAPKPWTTSDFR